MQKARASSQLERLERQQGHFVRDTIYFSHFEGDDFVAFCERRPTAGN